ncbi:bifunctional DNA primase/polymerase [Actinomadura sp. LCR2-06]|uniref:Bifunctional DNA primase/polymerase n=2 Tax=Actinomadura violacea TaxID=2819934 RepID=A0ABS3RXV2_9ACTN|nr:bifunctional DNA primase/polymerase [Actinomadura violacea]
MVGAATPGCYAAGLDSISGVLEPTTHLERIHQWWKKWPEAGIVTPVGEVFEAITLPIRVGERVLEALTERGAWLGPVMSDDGTISLLIESGQTGAWADSVDASRAELVHTGPGQLIVLPSGGTGENDHTRWVVPPTDANVTRLPRFQELSPILLNVHRAQQRKRWLR